MNEGVIGLLIEGFIHQRV